MEVDECQIGGTTVPRLPERASVKLPSRGQVAVRGTIGRHQFHTVLESAGDFGHWQVNDPQRRRERAASLEHRHGRSEIGSASLTTVSLVHYGDQ
jgi:hypothetical protein